MTLSEWMDLFPHQIWEGPPYTATGYVRDLAYHTSRLLFESPPIPLPATRVLRLRFRVTSHPSTAACHMSHLLCLRFKVTSRSPVVTCHASLIFDS
jgi:hypothetical protein